MHLNSPVLFYNASSLSPPLGLPIPHILSTLLFPTVTHPSPVNTHRSMLLDLLVVGDDLPDAIYKAALVVGDEAHEYSLLG